jgi:hypothetical protein
VHDVEVLIGRIGLASSLLLVACELTGNGFMSLDRCAIHVSATRYCERTYPVRPHCTVPVDERDCRRMELNVKISLCVEED